LFWTKTKKIAKFSILKKKRVTMDEIWTSFDDITTAAVPFRPSTDGVT